MVQGQDGRPVFTAGADLNAVLSTNNEAQLVDLDNSGLVVASATSSVRCVGALYSNVLTGEKATVVNDEVVILRTAGAINAGTGVKKDAVDANEIVASLTADDPRAVIGYALETSTGADEYIKVRLTL